MDPYSLIQKDFLKKKIQFIPKYFLNSTSWGKVWSKLCFHMFYSSSYW